MPLQEHVYENTFLFVFNYVAINYQKRARKFGFYFANKIRVRRKQVYVVMINPIFN